MQKKQIFRLVAFSERSEHSNGIGRGKTVKTYGFYHLSRFIQSRLHVMYRGFLKLDPIFSRIFANRGKKWKLWYQRHLRAYYRPVECSLSILLYSQYKGHRKPSVRKILDRGKNHKKNEKIENRKIRIFVFH